MGVNWTAVNKNYWKSRRDSWILECGGPDNLEAVQVLLLEFESILLPEAVHPNFMKLRDQWVAKLKGPAYPWDTERKMECGFYCLMISC